MNKMPDVKTALAKKYSGGGFFVAIKGKRLFYSRDAQYYGNRIHSPYILMILKIIVKKLIIFLKLYS